MVAPMYPVYVLHAFICDEIRGRAKEGGRTDFIGVRDVVELPASGSLVLKGHLVLKMSHGPVLPPEGGVAVPADVVSLELTLRFIGPSGPVAPTYKRTAVFERSMARETVGLAGLTLREIGMHAIEVAGDGRVITVVPLLVAPHGALKAIGAAQPLASGPGETWH